MKRYGRTAIMLGVLFSAWMGLGCGGCDEIKKLRWQPGEQYRQKVRLVSDLKMPPFPNADYAETEMILGYEVKEADEQGGATVRVTIERITASMRSLTFSARYDSEEPPPPEQATGTDTRDSDVLRKFVKCFTGLKGAGYSARINSKGEVEKVFEMDSALERIAQGAVLDVTVGGHQVALLLSPTNLREYVAPAGWAAWLKDKPGVGKTWVNYEPMETPRTMPIMVKKSYKLDKVAKTGTDKMAQVSFTTAGDLGKVPEYARPKSDVGRKEVEIAAIQEGKGQIEFSLLKGRLVKSQETLVAEVIFPSVEKAKPTTEVQDNPNKAKRRILYVVDKTIELWEK